MAVKQTGRKQHVSMQGKRIDMEMSSPNYKFKLNIRDTQGKDGYPTRMMCDFTTLKV